MSNKKYKKYNFYPNLSLSIVKSFVLIKKLHENGI